jgi:hypothetical protein
MEAGAIGIGYRWPLKEKARRAFASRAGSIGYDRCAVIVTQAATLGTIATAQTRLSARALRRFSIP